MGKDEDKDYLETETDETPETEETSEEDTSEDYSQEKPEVDADSDDSKDVDDELSEEEFNKLAPEEKRYYQQAKGNKEEALKYRQMVIETEIAKAGEDANSVLELNKKDPKMAKAVAAHYGFDSIEAVELFIKKKLAGESNLYDEEEIMKRAEKIAEKKIKEKEHEKAVSKIANKIAKLPKEFQEEAQSYVDKLIDGKTIDSDDASMYADMVTLFVKQKKGKSKSRVDGLAELSSTGIGSGKTDKPTKDSNYVVIGGKLVLDSSN